MTSDDWRTSYFDRIKEAEPATPEQDAAVEELPVEAPLPPPVMRTAPPELPTGLQTGYQHAAPQQTKPKGLLQRIWTGLLTIIAATWKFAYPVFKLAKMGKLLLTAGSMLLSMWFYAYRYGWAFGVGLVVCIFIHELGHVFAAWRLKQPVSTPIFIPGMGALILLKNSNLSAYHQAIIGIGGPVFGALSGVGCLALYFGTRNPLFIGLALMAFFLNLFNMIPIYPLDGGRIVAAVSPYIWVVGIVLMVVGMFTLHITNPFIFIIILLSLPSIIQGFKRGTIDPPGKFTTKTQKVIMGLAYVVLAAFLAGGVSVSALIAADNQSNRSSDSVVMSGLNRTEFPQTARA